MINIQQFHSIKQFQKSYGGLIGGRLAQKKNRILHLKRLITSVYGYWNYSDSNDIFFKHVNNPHEHVARYEI